VTALRSTPAWSATLPPLLLGAPVVAPPLPAPPAHVPDVRVALPGGEQGELPGFLWPELAREVAGSGGGSSAPLVGIYPVDKKVANPFYERWHDLGACHRPFGRQDFELRAGGEVVAMATSCSTVNKSVTGTLKRKNTVDLARIAASGRHPHALRAMLRLYRLYLAPMWETYWPIDAVVAHALPGRRGGQLYRFDGWTHIRDCKKSGGGGTYSRPSVTNDMGDGIKSLWGFAYTDLPLDGDPPTTETAARPEQLALLALAPPAPERCPQLPGPSVEIAA
jgi:hypothetical protein